MIRDTGLRAGSFALCLFAVSQVCAADEALAGFDCLIEPYRVTEVSTRQEGVLEEMLVDRGDEVARRQPLAQLESDIERVAVELARSRANRDALIEEQKVNKGFAERRRARVHELYKNKAISFEDKDKADTDVVQAELKLRQARQDLHVARLELHRAQTALKLRTITSPIDGVVMELLLSAGESVKDHPIVRLAQIDPLRVEIIVPVARLGEIHRGMMAEVVPLAPHAPAYRATVTAVDPVVDAASGTFGVQLDLPNPGHRISGGLRCSIRFVD